jgi:hypothetical protein
MAETAQIIDLGDHRRTHVSAPEKFSVEVRSYQSESAEGLKRDTDIDDLYVGDTPTAQLISRARQLLVSCEERASLAQALLDDDLVGSDNEISLLQANLPELFCFRELSDGLGAIILAIYHALVNRRGSPLNGDQIYALRLAFEALHANPFLPFSEALDLIDGIVSTSLVTDPPEAEFLSDIFVG